MYNLHCKSKLALYRPGDSEWIGLHGEESYDDIICHEILLCTPHKWSRRIATMLPWLVVPLIGLWALSQLLPPAFLFEITSPRLACVFVLLVTLFCLPSIGLETVNGLAFMGEESYDDIICYENLLCALRWNLSVEITRPQFRLRSIKVARLVQFTLLMIIGILESSGEFSRLGPIGFGSNARTGIALEELRTGTYFGGYDFLKSPPS
ncbi:unnamed protein product [Fraxinus pennsylvanica]|uniref:Uncharacterized protein n=1 Tax=Fraxinus pennsylvanica TaxID=56036 RepID=A0AAD2DYG0_9LAMI|nr:unnamed protein product [Fraxinus pennsylvanica]